MQKVDRHVAFGLSLLECMRMGLSYSAVEAQRACVSGHTCEDQGTVKMRPQTLNPKPGTLSFWRGLCSGVDLLEQPLWRGNKTSMYVSPKPQN